MDTLSDSFNMFRENRIRVFLGEKVDFYELKKGYWKYRADMDKEGIFLFKDTGTPLFLKCFYSAFGRPEDGKTFENIKVFLEDSDVKEFDRKHQTLLTSTL